MKREQIVVNVDAALNLSCGCGNNEMMNSCKLSVYSISYSLYRTPQTYDEKVKLLKRCWIDVVNMIELEEGQVRSIKSGAPLLGCKVQGASGLEGWSF